MPDLDVVRRQAYNLRLLAGWFLYTTFIGAVRKWVFTDALTGNMLLGIQIGAPILFAWLARSRRLDARAVTLLTGYSLLLLLMIVNPLAQSLMHGVIGFFLHTAVFVPLFIYLNDRDAFPVERLNYLILLVIGVEVVLGTVQFLSPATSVINKYVRDTSEIGGIAMLNAVHRVRITGTFSYIGGMTALFTMVGFVVWGLRLTRQSPVWVGLLLLSCAIVSPMTGSRGLSALLIILIGCGFLATITDTRRTVGLALLAGGVLLGLSFMGASIVGEAYQGLNQRIVAHGQDGETRSRIIGQLEEIINFRGDYPLFGTGLGGTYQGAKALFGESRLLRAYGFYEEELERVVLEGGYVLLLARLLLWWAIFRRSAIPTLYRLLLLWLHLFYQVTVFNVFTAFYTVMGLMYLDRCYWLSRQPKPVL